MANPFEDFVQLELAKRPYTPGDGAEETLLVRRGPGPRQLSFLVIEEGQVVGKVGGVLTGITLSGGSTIAMHTHKQEVASASWDVVHNRNNRYFAYSVYDAAGKSILPDEIHIVDQNSVSITFSTPISGHVVLSFDPLAL